MNNIKFELPFDQAIELAFILDNRASDIEGKMADLEITGDPEDPQDYKVMQELDRDHSFIMALIKNLHKNNPRIRDGMFATIRAEILTKRDEVI